jgi:hypothetical protein
MKEHGFFRRLIECRCGERMSPDVFDAHLRAEMLAGMKADMQRQLRDANRRNAKSQTRTLGEDEG